MVCTSCTRASLDSSRGTAFFTKDPGPRPSREYQQACSPRCSSRRCCQPDVKFAILTTFSADVDFRTILENAHGTPTKPRGLESSAGFAKTTSFSKRPRHNNTSSRSPKSERHMQGLAVRSPVQLSHRVFAAATSHTGKPGQYIAELEP